MEFQNKVITKERWGYLFYDFSFHLQWPGKIQMIKINKRKTI